MNQRLSPLQPPFNSEVLAALANYPKQDGYLLQLFRVFANSLRFLNKGVVNLLDDKSPLLLRQRELVILRVCANNNCEYEWGVHISVFAQKAEFTELQIESTRLGDANCECWVNEESALIRVVDQLCESGRLSNDLSKQFANEWTIEQQLEIIALCGNYHTVSFVANVANLQSEPFAAKFPSRL